MKKNAVITSALENRISFQKNQSIDLNTWIFEKLNVDSNSKVLELCCGTGSQTAYFEKEIKLGFVVSIDINKESVEKAKFNTKSKKIKFIVSELDNTDNYINDNYDLIFSAYGFYYSKNPVELHKKLKLSLNEKGRFVLVGPVLGNNIQLYNIVKSIGCEIPEEVIEGSENFTIEFLKIFLKEYKDVKFFRSINQIKYGSHEELLDYWKNTTFYSPGNDQKFLDASIRYFQNDIVINKSISYLEGSL